MTIDVYIASAYMLRKCDCHEEGGRVLKFAEVEGVRFIGLSTPDFFPSIASSLRRMPIKKIEIPEE
jgi:hypothetical protein